VMMLRCGNHRVEFEWEGDLFPMFAWAGEGDRAPDSRTAFRPAARRARSAAPACRAPAATRRSRARGTPRNTGASTESGARPRPRGDGRAAGSAGAGGTSPRTR
jgi:hypothetical protein